MSRRSSRLIAPRIEEPVLNLERIHFQTVISQIRITGTWFRRGPGDWTPCLALTDGRKDIRKCAPCLILLENAWMWAFHGDVGDPKAVFITITDWLRNGLLPGEPGFANDYMRIVAAVNERLSDLIAMPPPPPMDTVAIGHAIITNSTGGTIEQEIVNDV